MRTVSVTLATGHSSVTQTARLLTHITLSSLLPFEPFFISSSHPTVRCQNLGINDYWNSCRHETCLTYEESLHPTAPSFMLKGSFLLQAHPLDAIQESAMKNSNGVSLNVKP